MYLIIFNILDKLKSKIVTGYSSKRHSFLVFDEVRITSYTSLYSYYYFPTYLPTSLLNLLMSLTKGMDPNCSFIGRGRLGT